MFIESCKFMSFSLDKLASNLHLDQCKYLKKSYEGDRAVNVLTQKVYIRVSIWIVGRNLKAAYSNLNMKGTSNQDYEQVRQDVLL